MDSSSESRKAVSGKATHGGDKAQEATHGGSAVEESDIWFFSYLDFIVFICLFSGYSRLKFLVIECLVLRSVRIFSCLNFLNFDHLVEISNFDKESVRTGFII